MKNINLAVAIVFSLAVNSLEAQSTFQNLNFESATLQYVPSGQSGSWVSASAGIPGWIGYVNDTPQSQVLQNNLTIGSGSVDIFGPYYDPYYIIDGNYSVGLQTGIFGSTALGQTGTLPTDAGTIQFKAWSTGDFSVSFAGQTLKVTSIGSGSNYTLYSADVSLFAGLTGELKFTSLFNPNHSTGMVLDSISIIAVPEPSALALGLMGVGVFLSRRVLKF